MVYWNEEIQNNPPTYWKANEESSVCPSSNWCSPHTQIGRINVSSIQLIFRIWFKRLTNQILYVFKCCFCFEKNGNYGEFVINTLITKTEYIVTKFFKIPRKVMRNQHWLEKLRTAYSLDMYSTLSKGTLALNRVTPSFTMWFPLSPSLAVSYTEPRDLEEKKIFLTRQTITFSPTVVPFCLSWRV